MSIVRVRVPGGSQHTLTCRPDAPLSEFLAQINVLCKIPIERIELLIGFPPKLLTSSSATPLGEFLSNGSVCTVRERPYTDEKVFVLSLPSVMCIFMRDVHVRMYVFMNEYSLSLTLSL
jgi:hypothetical protein